MWLWEWGGGATSKCMQQLLFLSKLEGYSGTDGNEKYLLQKVASTYLYVQRVMRYIDVNLPTSTKMRKPNDSSVYILLSSTLIADFTFHFIN